jgi:hypothetical protein
MRYYYLKIGKSNELAIEWLKGNNPLNKSAAVIFFGKTKVKDLLKKEGTEQAEGFCKAGLAENRNKINAIVIADGTLWIIKPKSNVSEVKRDEKDIWKAMEVKILKKKSLNNIPPILASIGSNRYLSGGTFREIKSFGNIKAIQVVKNGNLSKNQYYKKNLTYLRLLECLSSVELETLIAKIFECSGCFVPAYRGGYMKDIDIFATNETTKIINLDGIIIKRKETISIQVKSNLGNFKNSIANYCIALNTKNNSDVFNEDWIINQLKQYPNVKEWLLKSLSWLPKSFLDYYKL